MRKISRTLLSSIITDGEILVYSSDNSKTKGQSSQWNTPSPHSKIKTVLIGSF
jgi:hypothetical protein